MIGKYKENAIIDRNLLSSDLFVGLVSPESEAFS